MTHKDLIPEKWSSHKESTKPKNFIFDWISFWVRRSHKPPALAVDIPTTS